MSCNTGTQLIGGGYSNNDGGGSYGWVSTPLFAGDSVVNSFWTHLALQDEYFATSGSSGTTLTAYALCAESTNPAAIHLYEAVGFQKVKKLLTFKKLRI